MKTLLLTTTLLIATVFSVNAMADSGDKVYSANQFAVLKTYSEINRIESNYDKASSKLAEVIGVMATTKNKSKSNINKLNKEFLTQSKIIDKILAASDNLETPLVTDAEVSPHLTNAVLLHKQWAKMQSKKLIAFLGGDMDSTEQYRLSADEIGHKEAQALVSAYVAAGITPDDHI